MQPAGQDQINTSIKYNAFSEHTLELIDNYTNDILNGRTNLDRFNLPEHAGLCTAGAPLIGAYIVCNYARRSLETSGDATTGQTGSPTNWEIDAKQEELVQHLTQPYIGCKRLATKAEIDEMVVAKGFRDNYGGQGVNYIGDRLHLEDMHPANVFIDLLTDKPTCIDCIVKFIRKK